MSINHSLRSGTFGEPTRVQECQVLTTRIEQWQVVESYCRDFHATNGRLLIEDYLPTPTHPHYVKVLHDLLLAHLKLARRYGKPSPLTSLRKQFPQAFRMPKHASELENCAHSLWEKSSLNNPSLLSQRQLDLQALELPPTIRDESSYLQEQGHTTPESKKSAKGRSEEAFPEIGTKFAGFQLLDVIGVGTFARVYLAQQPNMANRLVVIKVSKEKVCETTLLAQLLHTNIVPVYSSHDFGPFHVTCMPFLGRVTLANLLDQFRASGVSRSGKGLVETLLANSTTKTADSFSLKDSTLSPPQSFTWENTEKDSEGRISVQPGTRLILQNLESSSYADAVLWIMRQLTDGLAHAHDRGILHRDLKPANVLLTVEGQPMLLDFNLAEDLKLRNINECARQGGTLPYMSPEQMGSFMGKPHVLDERSDVYSLGVIFFELMTGNYPFRQHSGGLRRIAEKMYADRLQGPPPFPKTAKSIPPGVAAIIRKCLSPNPDERYQSAHHLGEDIQLQLDNQPLRHADNPSVWELTTKWRKRHPRLASLTTVMSSAALIIVLLTFGFYQRGQYLMRAQAETQFQQFEKAFAQTNANYAGPVASEEELHKVIQNSEQALNTYQVLSNADWRKQPTWQYLAPQQKQKLQTDIVSLLMLSARARTSKALVSQNNDERQALLNEALQRNELAQQQITSAPPRSLLAQRAELMALQGKKKKADDLEQQAKAMPIQGNGDTLMLARAAMAKSDYANALQLIESIIEQESNNPAAWMLKGLCQERLGNTSEAHACYTACVALQPLHLQARVRLGLLHLQARRYANADSEFSRVLEIDPTSAATYFNRAMARHGNGDTASAVADLDQAIELKLPVTRVYFLRSRYLKSMGRQEDSQRDFEKGLALQPTDLDSWLARGVAKVSTGDRLGALADFEAALRLNGNSKSALFNEAFILSRLVGSQKEALAVLDTLLQKFPNDRKSLQTHAELCVRLGEHEKAVTDVTKLCQLDRSGPTLFFAAQILARTNQADDRKQALALLREGLLRGHGFQELDSAAFAALRNEPEFQQLRTAARTLLANN